MRRRSFFVRAPAEWFTVSAHILFNIIHCRHADGDRLVEIPPLGVIYMLHSLHRLHGNGRKRMGQCRKYKSERLTLLAVEESFKGTQTHPPTHTHACTHTHTHTCANEARPYIVSVGTAITFPLRRQLAASATRSIYFWSVASCEDGVHTGRWSPHMQHANEL